MEWGWSNPAPNRLGCLPVWAGPAVVNSRSGKPIRMIRQKMFLIIHFQLVKFCRLKFTKLSKVRIVLESSQFAAPFDDILFMRSRSCR